jgi:hypothetical protein
MKNSNIIKIKNKTHGGLLFSGTAEQALAVVERLRQLKDPDEQDELTQFLWALEIACQEHGLLDNEFNIIDRDSVQDEPSTN